MLSVDQRIKDIRKELKSLEENDADVYSIIKRKRCLSEALIEKDPPEYFEAIKLKGEIVIWLERELGPDHEVTMAEKRSMLRMKSNYRNFLKTLNSP